MAKYRAGHNHDWLPSDEKLRRFKTEVKRGESFGLRDYDAGLRIWSVLRKEDKDLQGHFNERGEFVEGSPLEIILNPEAEGDKVVVVGDRGGKYSPRKFVQLQKEACKKRGKGSYYKLYRKKIAGEADSLMGLRKVESKGSGPWMISKKFVEYKK